MDQATFIQQLSSFITSHSYYLEHKGEQGTLEPGESITNFLIEDPSGEYEALNIVINPTI